ncbi:DUF3108 domain-containing protein [Kingella negevensis]|uniref:DUF3108 domain-containing protein n=1 Tax=Kingella negevensis TaxID=1522312 RepID=A0A238HHS1_9NEIS|nr:DUF3108 domain-containing protein [Kingella negevensis]MDK4697872.1 DUF3108 domain-containing protein [Kingella negevensis]SNB72539.1 Uncharacterised protein [Kingella negevensis]
MGIPATMTFKCTGDSYTIVANINMPKYKMSFQTGGKIVGNELQPEYYRDIRNGKTYATATFAHSQVKYRKPDYQEVKTVNGAVSDLFSLTWQLGANEGKLSSNMSVTNGKTVHKVGSLKALSDTKLTINGTSMPVSQFSLKRGDSNVKYGFAPDLVHILAIISYSDGRKSYNLTLKSAVIDGVSVQP